MVCQVFRSMGKYCLPTDPAMHTTTAPVFCMLYSNTPQPATAVTTSGRTDLCCSAPFIFWPKSPELERKKKKSHCLSYRCTSEQAQPNSHCPVSPIPKPSHSSSSAMCFREPGNRKLCTRVYWRWWPHIPVGPQLGWGTQNWWVCKEHCSNLLMSHIADGTQYW